jgi:hypothetical protein
MRRFVTLCVSLVACLMFAGVATAAPVVYRLSATSPADFGGTITLDLDVAPTSTDGTKDTYVWGNAGIVAFSIYQPNATTHVTDSDNVSDFALTFLAADDTPQALFMDVDEAVGAGAMFGNLDFSVASQTFDTQGIVTNAALAPTDFETDSPASYRIMFITTGGVIDSTSADIGTYNTYVSGVAAADTAMNALGATWKAVGSTLLVDARDNTSTQPLGVAGYDAANDVPIYNLNGDLLAADNAALWGAPATLLALRLDGTPVGQVSRVLSGTLANGVKSIGSDNGYWGDVGGTSYVTHGNPSILDQSGTGKWIKGNTIYFTEKHPLYALSSVIGGGPVATPGTVFMVR